MKKYHIIPIIFWIGFSLFVMVLSYKLGLEGFHNPGPGLMPFLMGALLLIISLYVLISALFGKRQTRGAAGDEQRQIDLSKIILVLASMFAYAILLERLGYLITTFSLLTLLFKSMGSKRWSFALLNSALVVLISYFVFTFLGARFPEGILKFRGF